MPSAGGPSGKVPTLGPGNGGGSPGIIRQIYCFSSRYFSVVKILDTGMHHLLLLGTLAQYFEDFLKAVFGRNVLLC